MAFFFLNAAGDGSVVSYAVSPQPVTPRRIRCHASFEAPLRGAPQDGGDVLAPFALNTLSPRTTHLAMRERSTRLPNPDKAVAILRCEGRARASKDAPRLPKPFCRSQMQRTGCLERRASFETPLARGTSGWRGCVPSHPLNVYPESPTSSGHSRTTPLAILRCEARPSLEGRTPT